ncbi:elongation factor P [Buchnera aphidicola (Nipponaphis monzeni)]|uniref:Elongation factor P n=1 Tax=Buchnera aphidicola (Nipponaphis monzeni) TaxID=2495405 RepID=A0A455T9L6_9GAMM|nr:elongation factor P [Buchnera aphidicola]BBI01037.1 elongation factor P [Buchnera aphidicola (Nipponaphis monzeni)]
MIISNTNKLKNGSKIILNNEPYLVESTTFVKPGKGQTFVRTKLRKLLTGKIIDKTFKSTDSLNIANIINTIVIYLYNDHQIYYFMHAKNFDQLSIKKTSLNNCIQWLIKGEKYSSIQWNNKLISIIPNNFVILQVISIAPNTKSDSITSGYKFVKLSTGIILKVPSFIQINDFLKINTYSGQYVARIKKNKQNFKYR